MEIKKLNTLRGLAAFIVIVSHYSNQSNLYNGLLGEGAGQLGVMLFFILSGFLICYLYFHKKLTKTQVYNYIIARIARVIPLFLFIVILSYIFQKFELKGYFYNIANKETLISHLLFVKGKSVLWTIPSEIQFYLLFVLVWLLCKSQNLYLFLTFFLVTFWSFYTGFPIYKGNTFGFPFDIRVLQTLPYFLIGACMGGLYHTWNKPIKIQNSAFLFLLLFIPVLFPKIYLIITGNNHLMWQDMSVLFTVSVVFFAYVFLVPDNNILVSNKLGDFCGKISYSLYLIHLPILWQLKEVSQNHPVLFFIPYLLITVSFSFLTYSFLEKPMRKLIRNLFLKKNGHE